ncbi:hypothetical protein [Bacillus paramycoides]|uniref:hypothetical protein n=1 Tax=Bacillus paramycoides TaxID=2026194 RepID=UPI002E1FF07A|nr:hypothetical protein [Bacillus paramycoides]
MEKQQNQVQKEVTEKRELVCGTWPGCCGSYKDCAATGYLYPSGNVGFSYCGC